MKSMYTYKFDKFDKFNVRNRTQRSLRQTIFYCQEIKSYGNFSYLTREHL